MAALLIHTKSNMLLPRLSAESTEENADDPRQDLVRRLLEHERFKQAAQMLQQREQVEQATWSNPGMREFFEEEEQQNDAAPESSDAGSFDLVSIFRLARERAANRTTLIMESDAITVAQMVEYLRRRLQVDDVPVAFTSILTNSPSRQLVTTTFLALLELARAGAVLIRQDNNCANIFIKKTAIFHEVMSQNISFGSEWT
jgi:segregation and condensation protein A